MSRRNRHGIMMYRAGCRCRLCVYGQAEYEAALVRYGVLQGPKSPIPLVPPVLEVSRSAKKGAWASREAKTALGKPGDKFALCTVCAGPVYRWTRGGQCSQSCYERWQRSNGTSSFTAQRGPRHSSLAPPKVVVLDRSLTALGKGDRAKLIAYLRERDGNRCQIPGCRYRSKQMGAGPRKPSLDHIIPLTKGGVNELANIQLAHYRCNLIKNNRAVGDQLALIG